MPKLWIVFALLIAIAGGIAFTAPGHRMLYKLGFSAACTSSDCGD